MPASGALRMAKHLVGKNNVFRITLIVPAGHYGLDGLKEIASLPGLGRSEARNEVSSLILISVTEPSEPIKTFHKLK